jgi:hypothetical protein
MNKILYASKQLQTWRRCEFLDQQQQFKRIWTLFFDVFHNNKANQYDDDDDDNNNNKRLTELLVSGRIEAFMSSALDFSFYYFRFRIFISVYISTFFLLVRLPGTFHSILVVVLTAESGSSTVSSLVVIVVAVLVKVKQSRYRPGVAQSVPGS